MCCFKNFTWNMYLYPTSFSKADRKTVYAKEKGIFTLRSNLTFDKQENMQKEEKRW